MMYGKQKGENVYSIPVEWVVTENLQVRADSLREAVKFICDNADEFPTSRDAEYIDGTYRITGDEDWSGDVEKITENLELYGYTGRKATEHDTVDSKIGGAA